MHHYTTYLIEKSCTQQHTSLKNCTQQAIYYFRDLSVPNNQINFICPPPLMDETFSSSWTLSVQACKKSVLDQIYRRMFCNHILCTHVLLPCSYCFCILLWAATDMSKVTVHCCQDCLLGIPNMYMHLLVWEIPNINLQFIYMCVFGNAKYLFPHIIVMRTKYLIAIFLFWEPSSYLHLTMSN